MKDELGVKTMTEFIALRPKLYAHRKLNDEAGRKCKGIKTCMVKKTLHFDDYKRCLFNPGKSKNTYRSQLMFRNRKREVYTFQINKVALNRDDDK